MNVKHEKSIEEYMDIIGQKRPISKKHPAMSRQDRAAQFAPFAALTGHGDAIRQTAEKVIERQDR